MQIFSSLICFISSIFFSISTTNQYKNSIIIRNEENNIYKEVLTSDSDEEDYDIFHDALNEYKVNFKFYINVLSINVDDKSSIKLDNYNPNYIVPKFEDVMYKREVYFESSLNNDEMSKYETLKRNNQEFDKYVAMNLNKYTNLNPKTTYEHKDPLKVPVSALGIGSLLTSAGLGNAIISAFNACISTITTALSSTWIPIIGQTIAIGIIVGALIGLTTIIVLNWDKITTIFDDIVDYFLDRFSSITNLINNFFNNCLEKVKESFRVEQRKIGNQKITFTQCDWTDAKRILGLLAIMENEENLVLLMDSIKDGTFLFGETIMTYDFCVRYQTHDKGYSSYVFFESKARSLILYAGSGFTSEKPEINDCMLANYYYFYHFHNYDEFFNRYDTFPKNKTHSFFGLPIVG